MSRYYRHRYRDNFAGLSGIAAVRQRRPIAVGDIKLGKLFSVFFCLAPIFAIAGMGAISGIGYSAAVNADALYPLALASDIVGGFTPMHWVLTPANGWFPDVLIVLVGKLLGYDGARSFMFFSAVYYVLLYLSMAFFVSAVEQRHRLAWSISLIAVTIIAFVDLGHPQPARILISPAHHSGIVPVQLILFGILMRSLRNDSVVLRTTAFAIALLAGFSDSLIWVQVIAPAAVVCIIIAVLRKDFLRPARWNIGFIVLGAAIGTLIRSKLRVVAGFHHGQMTSEPIGIQQAFTSLKFFIGSIPAMFNDMGTIRVTLVALGFVLAIVLVGREILGSRQLSDRALAFALLLLASAASIAGPIAFGTFTDIAVIRQQLPGYLIPILIVCWFVFSYLRTLISERGVAIAAIVAAFIGLGWNTAYAERTQSLTMSRFLSPQRAMLAALGDTDLIMAGYWDAKTLYIASGRQSLVCGIAQGAGVYPWITNLGWCENGLTKWNTQKGWLAVGGQDISPDATIAALGVPDRRIDVLGRSFLMYKWNETLSAKVSDRVCGALSGFKPSIKCS